MKILVMSDSHSGLHFMRRGVEKIHPDVLIHLGDRWDDGEVIREENPCIPFYRVPGNCDLGHVYPYPPESLCVDIGGVKVYITHGHRQWVKLEMNRLLGEARDAGADAVLFGHTHYPLCRREERDGLLVMNPGSCGSDSGSMGLMEIQNGKITSCRILRQADVEEYQ